MPASFPLFDEHHLSLLMEELGRSMRRLLTQLCEELDGPYRQSSKRLTIPTRFFRMIGTVLGVKEFSHWKVVGWIEELNDLVYLLDVSQQLARDSDKRGFAEAFFTTCTAQYYEHSHLEELFPQELPRACDLARRLSALCTKLAGQITRESWFLVPGLSCRWLETIRQERWSIPYDLGHNFERAEPAGSISLGLDGDLLCPQPVDHQSFCPRRTRLLLYRDKIELDVDKGRLPILVIDAAHQWRGRLECPWIIERSPTRMTVGHTLVYGKNRAPVDVISSPPELADRIAHARRTIEKIWPEGIRNVDRLTARIIPLRASGVVSFSYRHRPGLSFINCFDRDQFDLIDDLVHENSHHQLNLYLRKVDLLRGIHTDELFYSPWRRSLRPLRGILHATFTFTMGTLLFDRLASSPDLKKADRLRAEARCLEEIESVNYSLRDLKYAACRLGWLTESGIELVDSLAREIGRVQRRVAKKRTALSSSSYGPNLRRHWETLRQARVLYNTALY